MRMRLPPTAVSVALLVLAVPALAPHAPARAQTTINLRDADIRTFIADVARVTGASFVIDPRVQGRISVVSERPLGRSQYFELFLSTLRANGYVAVPSGRGQYRIQPAEAGAGSIGRGGQFTTTVIPLDHIDAQQALESIRPALSRNGVIAANRSGNAVIVTDFADNVSRARQLLAKIDRDRSVTEVVPLKNAGARELAQSLSRLSTQPGQAGAGGAATTVVAIDASNALAIKGEPAQVKRLVTLARDLDRKADDGRETRVIFLENADASAIMPVLQQLMGQQPTPTGNATAGPTLPAGTPFAGNRQRGGLTSAPSTTTVSGSTGSAALTSTNIGVASGDPRARAIIARYEGANAIIIAATSDIQRELGEVIRQLDTRRAQVQVEAIIVEISDAAARQLGVQWMLAGRGGTVPLVSSTFSNAAPTLLAITGAIAADKGLIPGAAGEKFREAAVNSILGTTGITGSIGSIGNDTIFGFVINAVKGDVDSNILSTPSLLTLDNQPARILVGQEIPVTTGEALGNNLDNSFRTVQRQDVGIQLSVRPQINAGGTITLTLKQVVSSIASTVNTDFVLNKRELETAVTVGNGQILALGGLLEDSERRSFQRVPLLGDIPVLGTLFSSKTKNHTKTNLMIFIRPTIVRSQADADELTAGRWNTVREQQQERGGYASLDALAWDYLRTPPPYQPRPLPAGPSS